jgi:hypothetical protein
MASGAGEPVEPPPHQMRQFLERVRWTARGQGLSASLLKALRYPLMPLFVPGAIGIIRL